MTIDRGTGTEPVRAGADWLILREPADAAARARDLVEVVRSDISAGSGAVIHDLGCGSGSMARWLAGHLPGPQHWVMYDRDADLLDVAAVNPPGRASDGEPVTVETRLRDITRLESEELAGATLITASALLDMLTAEGLERLVSTSAAAGCPVLISLSVTGHVEITPPDPFDRMVENAFNAHQRRATASGRLLGPAAVGAAMAGFSRLGLEVLVRPSPWHLGPDQAELAAPWFTGWLAAACEQRPDLGAEAPAYARRRRAQAAAGQLEVTVHHQDLLARWPALPDRGSERSRPGREPGFLEAPHQPAERGDETQAPGWSKRSDSA